MMNNLSKTLFIPFYFKNLESIGEKEIYEKEAVEFFSKESNKNILNFSAIEKDKNSFTGIIVRTKIIDEYLLELISDDKIDNIFNIGCGLDFRNRRLGIEKNWYNIDLEEVIKFREEEFSKYKFEKNICGNILEIEKWDFIPKGKNLFIFEGILMYFTKEEVYKIIEKLKEKSEKSYFIIETMAEELAKVNHKAVHEVDKNIGFNWGVNDILKFSKEIELECLSSKKYIDYLKERWDKNKEGETELEKKIKENCRASLFVGKNR